MFPTPNSEKFSPPNSNVSSSATARIKHLENNVQQQKRDNEFSKQRSGKVNMPQLVEYTSPEQYTKAQKNNLDVNYTRHAHDVVIYGQKREATPTAKPRSNLASNVSKDFDFLTNW